MKKKENRELLHSKLVLSFGFGLDIGLVLAMDLHLDVSLGFDPLNKT